MLHTSLMKEPRTEAYKRAKTVFLGLILACGLRATVTAESNEKLFAPHSTVVLLSGLPGDVESENSYNEQLKGWLDLVQANGSIEKIFALSDNPESRNSEKLVGLKAERTNFLSLGATLSGNTNPL